MSAAYEAYGEKLLYGKKSMGIIRSTYVIQADTITHAWTKVKAAGHAEMVLEAIRAGKNEPTL